MWVPDLGGQPRGIGKAPVEMMLEEMAEASMFREHILAMKTAFHDRPSQLRERQSVKRDGARELV
jgi:hypothetical protein